MYRLDGGSIRAQREVRESEGVTSVIKKNQGSLVPSPATRGGEYFQKNWLGLCGLLSKPSPYSWPKSGIFVLYLWPEQKDIYHQLKARLQKPYPVYDQKWPKSMPHFWPKVLKTLPFRDGHTYIAHICKGVPSQPCLGIRVFALALSEGVTLACMMYILAQKPFSLLLKL